MDRSSRQLQDFAAWLVRNEGRSRRLTASSRDGGKEEDSAGTALCTSGFTVICVVSVIF
jgi:hypothetical protein